MILLCTIRPVIVAAMEDTEAPGFRFIPRKGPAAATAGERRPGAFVRLVTGIGRFLQATAANVRSGAVASGAEKPRIWVAKVAPRPRKAAGCQSSARGV